MKEMLRYGIVLALICVVASGLLAVVNSFTRPRIIAQAQAQEDAVLLELLPSAAYFEPVKPGEEILYYKGYNKDNQLTGVVFKASGKGYSSTIETMVGMTKDGKITAIKVIGLNETPGLGSRVSESAFMSQFANKDIPGLSQVQAITGATISSRAVINSVTNKAQEIKELIKNER
jgi:electron transport complex protein RnfG